MEKHVRIKMKDVIGIIFVKLSDRTEQRIPSEAVGFPIGFAKVQLGQMPGFLKVVGRKVLDLERMIFLDRFEDGGDIG